MVMRTSCDKLISVNFVLKLNFEKSLWRRPQKYHEGRQHFTSRVCLHTLQLPLWYALFSTANIRQWHANSALS